MRPSTNSGDRFCSDSSWVLTPDGSEQLVDGQRVPARHNELKHNLLVQFALLSGLTNGNSRGLEQHQAGQLMMQPEAFQMGLVAGAVSTDGCRKASKEGKEYFRVSQGRHCGHDSIVGDWSRGCSGQGAVLHGAAGACAGACISARRAERPQASPSSFMRLTT